MEEKIFKISKRSPRGKESKKFSGGDKKSQSRCG